MKRLLKSYTSFTRTERYGLIGLCILLVGLIAFRTIMQFWISPGFENREQLVAAYEENDRQNDDLSKSSPNRQHPATNSGLVPTSSPEISWPSSPSKESWFDPNTADSLTLRSFGLRPVAISNLLKWRAKGKRFYAKEDIKPLYTLTPEEYHMLEPYILIKQLRVNLNTADSATLVSVRGIGPKAAHKILVRRNTIGRFTSYEQLRELHKFPDGVFEKLKKELVLRE